jgi:hypothetical protein
MELKKALLIKFIIFIMVLSSTHPCFSQVKMGETISFSGVIESIPNDFSFIVINEVRIFIFLETNIINENGNVLKSTSLRPRLKVIVEASRIKEGFYAKKITLKKENKGK